MSTYSWEYKMFESKDGVQSISSDEKPQIYEKKPSRYSLWVAMGAVLLLLTTGLTLALALTLKHRQMLKHRHAQADRIELVVDLGYSRYNGRALQDGTSQWLGMRYAAPPVGNLRFAAPQDPIRNTNLQPADEYRPRCLPTLSAVSDGPIPTDRSEDCLFVNVQAPSHNTGFWNSSTKLPVYVFIQGGGFNDNSGTNDARELIKVSDMGIVVVDFNYRVGPYGFLTSSEVQAKGSLNNGLKDQRKLLHWVQEHISKFGGDPHHVVLGGASAGAASVTLQLAAYGGKNDNLFHATAAESQSFGAIRTVPESQYQYDELVTRTKCRLEDTGSKDTFSCLRGLSIKSLQKQNIKTKFPNTAMVPLFPYNPAIDNDFIQNYTFSLFEAGRFVRVPAIYGDVTDEGTVFVQRDIKSVEDQQSYIHAQYPTINDAQLDNLTTLYPPGNQQYSNTGKYWHATSAAYGELRYVCPGIHLSDLYSRYKVAGNFNYRYNVHPDTTNGIGVGHVAELGAIWGHGKPASEHRPSEFNADIPFLMQRYWISFIKTFDPNKLRAPGSPLWEEWTDDGSNKGKMTRLLIQDGSNATKMETVPEGQNKRCDTIIPWGYSLKQ